MGAEPSSLNTLSILPLGCPASSKFTFWKTILMNYCTLSGTSFLSKFKTALPLSPGLYNFLGEFSHNSYHFFLYDFFPLIALLVRFYSLTLRSIYNLWFPSVHLWSLSPFLGQWLFVCHQMSGTLKQVSALLSFSLGSNYTKVWLTSSSNQSKFWLSFSLFFFLCFDCLVWLLSCCSAFQ